jgi:hypothetical protein
MTRLPEDAIETMLRTDVGVNEKYINNPRFQELLRGIGPVMRAIGIAVSKLEYDYNEKTISDAKAAVQDYLSGNCKVLSATEIRALLGLVLTGVPVTPTDPICEGSSVTLDSLQNSGTIALIRASHDEMSYVFMSRLMLESFLNSKRSRGYLADSAKRLFGFIDSCGTDSFEKFVAHFHGMKKAVFVEECASQTSVGSVPLTKFFSGALIGSGLLREEVLLSSASVPLAFPDTVMWWQGNRHPDTAEPIDVSCYLKKGGVVLNSKGAGMDVLCCEKVRDIGNYDWQEGVIVYGVKHTIGDAELSCKEVSADLDEAVKTLSASENHSKALVTMVHFSNRDLPKELCDVTTWKPEWKRSIVVGRQNIESVVGPMFGRLLTSKAFYGLGKGSKPKTYSTLASVVPVSRIWRERFRVAWIIHLVR